MKAKPICRINFNVKQPKEFLRNNGMVYTIRTRRKYSGICRVLFDGKDVAIGYVTKVSRLNDAIKNGTINEYAKYSGFKSAEEWLNVAKSIYSYFYRVKSNLYIYKVRIIKWR